MASSSTALGENVLAIVSSEKGPSPVHAECDDALKLGSKLGSGNQKGRSSWERPFGI
jgi:hypothetical protein